MRLHDTTTTTRSSVRARVAAARSARRTTRALERELAIYDSPSDRLELEAVLARHSDQDAEPIRAILRGRDADRLHRVG